MAEGVKKVVLGSGGTRWEVSPYGPGNRRVRRRFKTQDEAKQFLNKVQSARYQGTGFDPRAQKMTVGSVASRWFDVLSVSPKTMEDYESLWRTHVQPHWGDRRLETVRPIDVREWAHKLLEGGLSPSRARKACIVLKQVFDLALENEYVSRTPVPSLRKLVPGSTLPSGTPRALTAGELERVGLAASDPSIIRAMNSMAGYDLLVLLSVDSCCRPGEIRALRRSRCHLDGPKPYIEIAETAGDVYRVGVVWKPPKNGRARNVRLSPSVVGLLKRHLDVHVGESSDALVFTSPEGEVLRWGNFNERVWRPALKAAGVEPILFRELRHTGASLMARAGVPLHEVKTHMGHSSITVTERYLGYYDEGSSVAAVDLPTFKERDIFGTLLAGYFDRGALMMS